MSKALVCFFFAFDVSSFPDAEMALRTWQLVEQQESRERQELYRSTVSRGRQRALFLKKKSFKMWIKEIPIWENLIPAWGQTQQSKIFFNLSQDALKAQCIILKTMRPFPLPWASSKKVCIYHNQMLLGIRVRQLSDLSVCGFVYTVARKKAIKFQ